MPRHAIFLTGPFIEIDQLATLGTERPPLVILPVNGLSARGTLRHIEKVRRKKTKVKDGAVARP